MTLAHRAIVNRGAFSSDEGDGLTFSATLILGRIEVAIPNLTVVFVQACAALVAFLGTLGPAPIVHPLSSESLLGIYDGERLPVLDIRAFVLLCRQQIGAVDQGHGVRRAGLGPRSFACGSEIVPTVIDLPFVQGEGPAPLSDTDGLGRHKPIQQVGAFRVFFETVQSDSLDTVACRLNVRMESLFLWQCVRDLAFAPTPLAVGLSAQSLLLCLETALLACHQSLDVVVVLAIAFLHWPISKVAPLVMIQVPEASHVEDLSVLCLGTRCGSEGGAPHAHPSRLILFLEAEHGHRLAIDNTAFFKSFIPKSLPVGRIIFHEFGVGPQVHQLRMIALLSIHGGLAHDGMARRFFPLAMWATLEAVSAIFHGVAALLAVSVGSGVPLRQPISFTKLLNGQGKRHVKFFFLDLVGSNTLEHLHRCCCEHLSPLFQLVAVLCLERISVVCRANILFTKLVMQELDLFGGVVPQLVRFAPIAVVELFPRHQLCAILRISTEVFTFPRERWLRCVP
mmetsp:Transcript_95080/g.198770  ORF Transcript_95080/g.198770 Transcript_95080/m.198770 type:complete len:509 (-) Transcript_95080:124-1650(-)